MTERQADQNGSRLPEQQPAAPDWRVLAWSLAAIMVLLYFIDVGPDNPVKVLSYTQFKEEVSSGAIPEVTIRGQEISGRLDAGASRQAIDDSSLSGDQEETGDAAQAAGQRFRSTIPSVDDPNLMPLLEENGVTVHAESARAEWWQRLLITMLPWLLIIGLILYFSKKMQERMASGGGMFSFGRSKAKRFNEEHPETGMRDIAGSDNAKRDLNEITEYLQDPERFRSLGAAIPRGVLMVGPPGTGKTLMAKAVAAEAGAPFFSISGSEFIEMFVGVGASRVRDMFKQAKDESPSIIFIDELDSIGRARGAGLGGGHDEREQTLNQILSEMDGFSERESVIVLAATNRPDVLDPALMRPGRFDRQVTFERPHKQARKAILGIHTRNKPLHDDVDLGTAAGRTVGFSGADLANLVNEAALLAAREERKRITMQDIAQARDKIVLGAEREEIIGEEEQKVIAYHESGHALMAALLPNADPLDKVTIIPRGRALGVTEQVPEDRYNMNRSYLMDRLGVMLGGREAEKLVFEQVSTGAEQDLKQATKLARRMVLSWGMSEALGPVAFQDGDEHPFLGREMAQSREYSEATAKVIDDEVRGLVVSMERRVDELLETNRHRLKALAESLLDRETLTSSEVEEVLTARA